MQSLAQRLIAEERRAGNHADTDSRAAFRVCEKLRRPLSTFAGASGFRSLLTRAVAMAKIDFSWLAGLQVRPDGSFEFSPEREAQLDSLPAAQAAQALTEQLLGLLNTFIGEALTLRLVYDVWPQTAFKDPKSGGK